MKMLRDMQPGLTTTALRYVAVLLQRVDLEGDNSMSLAEVVQVGVGPLPGSIWYVSLTVADVCPVVTSQPQISLFTVMNKRFYPG